MDCFSTLAHFRHFRHFSHFFLFASLLQTPYHKRYNYTLFAVYRQEMLKIPVAELTNASEIPMRSVEDI
jgi:hypothetical protein